MSRTKTVVRTRSSGRRARHPNGRRLPDDACPRCGIMMKAVKRRLTIRINGEPVVVDAVPHRRCPRCGEVVLTYEESGLFGRRAFEEYRRKHDLLSEAEIRAIRERLRLTQAELSRLLRLGSNTVSRWEAGRNVQSASMDIMLRVLRDVPGALAYLRATARGVAAKTPPVRSRSAPDPPAYTTPTIGNRTRCSS
jgi:putative zinc finger/helix-turn-helix YgiT family protein